MNGNTRAVVAGHDVKRHGCWQGPWIACLLVFVGMVRPTLAGGLQTRFVVVNISDVPIGYSVPLVLTNGARYSVENTSDKPVEVGLVVVKPEQRGNTADYMPIPDVAWVTLATNRLTVPPGATAETDITVKVPKKADFADKRYEFRIRAMTLDVQVGVALATKVRFNTVAKPASTSAPPPAAK